MEAASIPWRPIGELFVARGLIIQEQLEQALAEQAATGQRLGEILVRQNLISSPELTQVLMEQLGREVAKEEGFGSGLWAEIQRRNSRDDNPSRLSVVEADRSPFGPALGEAVAKTAEEPSTFDLSQAELDQDLDDLRTEFAVGAVGSPVREEASALGTPADLEGISRELAEKETTAASLTSELEQARESLAEREARLTELEAEVASLTLTSEHEAAAQPAPDEQMERELVVRAARLSELEHTLEVRETRIEQLERLAEEIRCERDAMNDRLTHAESRAAEAESRLHELEAAPTADASLQDERAAHARTRHASDHAVAEADRAREELREAERGLEVLRLERDEARSELEDVQTKVAAHELRASTLEEELAAAHAEVEQQRDEHDQARQRVEQLVDEIAGISVALAESERAVETARGERDTALSELEQRLAIAGSRAAELEVQVSALGERLEAGESELAGERDAHDSTRRLAEAARTKLDETAAKLQEVEALSAELAWAAEGLAEERSQLAAKASRDQREADLRLGALDARLAEETSSHAETRRALAQALEELAVESAPAVSGEGESVLQDYLCFAPGKEGYRLVHGSGWLPSLGDSYDLDGAGHVVTRIGRSPLPFDSRRCVYLQAS